jgi:hemerythrin-like metal-binding protein
MEYDFVWRPSYSDGHLMLDRQHRELFRLCKRASDCARGNLPAAAFSTIINDLAQCAFNHIDYEESVLLKCGYLPLDQHKENHLQFVTTITDFAYAAMYGTADMLAVADYAMDCWKSHVLVSDMKFRDAVLALGAGDIHAVATDESSPSPPVVKR